jgi:lysophospholipase L1-like esterase
VFWYHQDLERLEKEIEALEFDPRLVFYGSSSFTLWNELSSHFKEYDAINLGFGGSTLAACTWYFDRVFKNLNNVEAIIIYAGENDLGEGRHPEEVVLLLQNLLAKIKTKYGAIQCSIISIKPSFSRQHLSESIAYTNKNIETILLKEKNFHYLDVYDLMLNEDGSPNPKYYHVDGLHLSPAGYKLWLDEFKKHPEIFPIKIGK